MAKRGRSPLTGQGRPVDYGGYSWVNSWAHGGSQMWGAASPSKKRKLKSYERAPAIIYLTVLGVGLAVVVVSCLVELFR